MASAIAFLVELNEMIPLLGALVRWILNLVTVREVQRSWKPPQQLRADPWVCG